MESMLGRLLGANITLTLVPSQTVARIRADVGQVEQVVMNLAVNARDAMPSGGTLTIETSHVTLDTAEASYVMLAVSDTGVGIDETAQARIFEPFFTTKEKGKGTGLGLSTVFGIVQQSGGRIWVESKVGRGATFKVCFPAAAGTSDPMPAPSASRDSLNAIGAETVLLVEDNEQVRAVCRAVLRRSRYRVLEAMDGGGALLICEKHRGNIDLLLTDVILPHMNGRELAERATAVRPDMRVLFMSGYTAGEFGRDGVIDDGFAFIQKPFTPDALVRKIHEVLR
jgi:CheY-like chemotaxis protein